MPNLIFITLLLWSCKSLNFGPFWATKYKGLMMSIAFHYLSYFKLKVSLYLLLNFLCLTISSLCALPLAERVLIFAINSCNRIHSRVCHFHFNFTAYQELQRFTLWQSFGHWFVCWWYDGDNTIWPRSHLYKNYNGPVY